MTNSSRRAAWLTLVSGAAIGLSAVPPNLAAEEPPREVAEWPDGLGNHRAVIQVSEPAEAVRARIPWRRRDPDPEAKRVIVVEAASGQPVANTVAASVTREAGDLVFEARTAGEYYAYYMPFETTGWEYSPTCTYLKPEDTADPTWRQRVAGGVGLLPEARVTAIQARTDFHRFDPMEVIATEAETQALLAAHPGKPYLVFPEDRLHPIRMASDLPLRWIEAGPSTSFRCEAKRGELLAFQIGLYAARQAIEGLTAEPAPLAGGGGAFLPARGLTCINTSGSDWLGRPIAKTVSVDQGRVQALWFVFAVPRDARPGAYEGPLTLKPANAPSTQVTLRLTVLDEVSPDGGVGNVSNHSRLAWLNSRIGLDDEVVAPYTPVEVSGNTLRVLGRSVTLDHTGLPAQIHCPGGDLLARPMAFSVERRGVEGRWTGGLPRLVNQAPGKVAYHAASAGSGLALSCDVDAECDGYLNYRLVLRADRDTEVSDVRLDIPFRRDQATYMMGLKRKGGFRPDRWEWKWETAPHNSFWIGTAQAGLHCRLKTSDQSWDLGNSGFPPSWHNEGKGGASVFEEGDTVVARVYTGRRSLRAGEELEFRFGLLITPVKPLDPAHWNQRYYHMYAPPEEAVANGATVINIHHGNDLNQHINYPFLQTRELSDYVTRAHEKGLKVKIYYTVRELSDFCAEIWALRSLGDEIFVDGPGGQKDSWLQEHLIDHYIPAWHQPLGPARIDAAIATVGLSRWHNYYLEGLAWLIRNVGIDGLYLDGIGYDREIMKRARKAMDRARPGCLIDFHSGNDYVYMDRKVSPACLYAEHFPYVNSLWFGEMYDYNEPPDYWLVEVSGIPFGLYGEMLQDNGNPWRGMVYGMTARYYSGADPKHIWKLWDEFGIQDSETLGYWDPRCPVRTGRDDIPATAYRKKGRTLIALASWAQERAKVRLAIDWSALGLKAERACLYAPAIEGFQREAVFRPGDEIPVVPGRGWLLVVDESEREAPAREDATAGLRVLLEDDFDGTALSPEWKTKLSMRPGTALSVADGTMQIHAMANVCALTERPLPPGATLVQCRVFSGTDAGASWGPGLGLVWPNGWWRVNVRAEGRFGADNGQAQTFGGWSAPRRWYDLRIRLAGDTWVAEVGEDGEYWEIIGTRPAAELDGLPTAVRIGKMAGDGSNTDYEVLGPEGDCQIDTLRVWGRQ